MPVFIKSASKRGVTAVDNAFITDYMPKASGEHVKIYLYGLMKSAEPERGDEACPFDDGALAEAYGYWQSAGLVRVVKSDPLTVEYLPVGEQASASAASRKYASLVAALTAAAGTRVFSGVELSEIYDWIEVYRFDEEAAVLCVTDSIARHGARVKLWQMNAEAKLWADNSVFTEADARAFILRRDERLHGAQEILARWKRSRSATEDELALYTKWTGEWGIDPAVIMGVLPELTGAEKPSFKYLDAVLDSYRKRGALTPDAADALRRERDATAELARLMLERAGASRAPSAAQKDDADLWRNRWHMDAELLLLAADASAGLSQPYANIKKLVTSWHEAGVATLDAARADIEKRARDTKKADATRRNRAFSHSQRKYSDDELKNIGIDLLDE